MILEHILALSFPGATGLVMAAQVIASLSLLVFVHELGHFMAAKYFGIKVEKFYIFFDAGGKKLWSKTVGDTEYGIGWLPLGGYVKIAGMIDESMDKDQMSGEPEEWEFRTKPAWQRLIVMVGGIVMNLIVGYLIFMFFLSYYKGDYIVADKINQGIYAHEMGKKYGLQDHDVITAVNGKKVDRWSDAMGQATYMGGTLTVQRNGGTVEVAIPDTAFSLKKSGMSIATLYDEEVSVARVSPDSQASACGLQEKDIIRTLNGKKVSNFYQFTDWKGKEKGNSLQVGVERNGKIMNLTCVTDSAGIIGFNPGIDARKNNPTKDYSWGEVMKFAWQDGFNTIYYNAKGFGMMFTGKINPIESLQSPIAIATYFGGTWDWARFWYLTGIISFILAFMNILPIPALDGGHMLFIFVELIIGRRLSDEFLEKAQVLGMLILLPLMFLIMAKDIWQVIIKNLF